MSTEAMGHSLGLNFNQLSPLYLQVLVFTFVGSVWSMQHHYIIPSTSDPCPAKNCFTVSQFAKHADIYKDADTLLLFLPGQHLLDSDLSISSVRNFSMQKSDSSPPITVTIHCELAARLKFDTIQYVHVQNLSFLGCDNILFISITKFFLEGISFSNKVLGTWLHFFRADGDIIKCSFRSKFELKYKRAVLAFQNNYTISRICRVKGLVGKGVGAFLCMERCNITVSRSSFSGLSTSTLDDIFESYSIMYLYDHCIMTISDCVFTSNVHHRTSSNHGQGNMIRAEGVSSIMLTVCKSKFVTNELYNSLLWIENAQIIITESKFAINNMTNKDLGTRCILSAKYSNISISKSNFTSNIASSDTALVAVEETVLTIGRCKFTDNSGTVLKAKHSIVRICYSDFKQNNVISKSLVEVVEETVINISNSEFIDNTCGGGVEIYYSNGSISDSNFTGNWVSQMATISIIKAVTTISKCKLNSNVRGLSAAREGFYFRTPGAGLLTDNSHITITQCELSHNLAQGGTGAAAFLSSSNATIHKSIFYNNTAGETGGLSIQSLYATSRVIVSDTEFNKNQGSTGAALTSDVPCFDCVIIFKGTSVFAYNDVCTHIKNGFCYHLKGQGGAICFYSVNILVYGMVIVTSNVADYGGGIHVTGTNMTFLSNGSIQLAGNVARKEGGGIWASDSTIKWQDNDQNLESHIYFEENKAKFGGGLYLYYSKNCFIQKLPLRSMSRADTSPWQELTNITTDVGHKFLLFSPNNAGEFGSSLFKQEFTTCTVGNNTIDEYNSLLTFSDAKISDIGTLAVRICFCKMGKPDCMYNHSPQKLKTGEKFSVTVAIVDRRNYFVNGSVQSRMQVGLLPANQRNQSTTNGCTHLYFNLYSNIAHQQLIMSPLVPSPYYAPYTKLSVSPEKTLEIIFLYCIDCPIGFQKVISVTSCDCACDVSHLKPYISGCNPNNGTIVKEHSTAWISYINNRVNSSGYLIYPYCPKDYCLPPDWKVEINFSIPDGADVQCANNRTGTLCGACVSGLSLSLGNSHCVPCSDHWSGILLALVLGKLIAGIILVVLIMALNLSVTMGTLNGVIFYANIMCLNQSLFPEYVRDFIAIFNMEFDVNVCFYEGMDTYGKEWIKLAFPMYVIFLNIMIVVIGERSVLLARLFGKKDPVSTLCTIILLFYVKLVDFVINTFSFAVLHYPDDSQQVVWYKDGNVSFFNRKHIILMATATLILLAGIVHMLLLLLWPYLEHYKGKKPIIDKWIFHPNVCKLIEPYNKPYIKPHSYWCGLLLLVRSILHIFSAANVSEKVSINLLAAGIAVFCLLILKSVIIIIGSSSRIYTKWPIEVMEIFCHVNILWFCLLSLYTFKKERSQLIISNISGCLTIALFVAVLTYHLVTEICFKTSLCKNRMRQRSVVEGETENLLTQGGNTECAAVTTTEIDPPTPGELPLSVLLNQSNASKESIKETPDSENEAQGQQI